MFMPLSFSICYLISLNEKQQYYVYTSYLQLKSVAFTRFTQSTCKSLVSFYLTEFALIQV